MANRNECCRPRRDFIKLTAAAATSSAIAPMATMAGPFSKADMSNHLVARVAGKNSSTLYPVSIDMTAYQGKKARIRIVDDVTGGWAHITVDQIIFSDGTRAGGGIEDKHGYGSTTLTLLHDAKEAGLTVSAAPSLTDPDSPSELFEQARPLPQPVVEFAKTPRSSRPNRNSGESHYAGGRSRDSGESHYDPGTNSTAARFEQAKSLAQHEEAVRPLNEMLVGGCSPPSGWLPGNRGRWTLPSPGISRTTTRRAQVAGKVVRT